MKTKESTIKATKKKIKAVIHNLPLVHPCNMQVRVSDICDMAEVTMDDLYDVINGCEVSYGMYSIGSLEQDLDIPADECRHPLNAVTLS